MTNAKFKPVDEQFAYLKKGTAEIIREEELKAKLAKSLETGVPLRVYLGVDPTAPDLHLGHTVVLRKLKHFQDMGHTAVFLIGDFSAMIGDPTGVSETRPPLTREQVDANAKTYLDQVFKILDREKTEVRYNSEWLNKMNAVDVVRLCSHYRLARMLEREDFRTRLNQNQPISVHELLYPLLTAIDAVNLKSDVELGATEQKFNLLVHREIQREYGLPAQVVMTMPILVGRDGHRKMSKSLGNYIGITEPANEMFGKIMSIPDELMWLYLELLTDVPQAEIQKMRDGLTEPLPIVDPQNPRSILQAMAGRPSPMEIKTQLARDVVATFHGDEAAKRGADNFRRTIREKLTPEELSVIRLKPLTDGLSMRWESGANVEEGINRGLSTTIEKWSRLLATLRLIESTSEAERLMKQGGFEVDGKPIKDPTAKLDLKTPAAYTVKIGKKKFVRLVVE